MNRLAVDIVILPPPSIMNLAVKASEHLSLAHPASPITLSINRCYPHISLCMGVIPKKYLGHLVRVVDRVSSLADPLELELAQFIAHQIPTNELVYEFQVNRTSQISQLHEKILDTTAELLTNDAVTPDFFTPSAVGDITTSWVNNYRTGSSFDEFRPHITLSMGKIGESWGELPIKFTATQIAICHLGNYCTCRKILWEQKLITKS